jgi:hypothetical protein
MDTQLLIAQSADLIENYQSIIDSPILDRCNWIVMYGDRHTVTTDLNGRTELTIGPYPMQFTEKAKNEIVAMGPQYVPILAKDWYRKRLKQFELLTYL